MSTHVEGVLTSSGGSHMLAQNLGSRIRDSWRSMSTKRLVLCLAVTVALFAQGERGTFNGSVVDSSGSAVVGASVKALNPATGAESSTVTTEAGVYRMP